MTRRRSVLSVPGSEARFHESAARSEADEVMLDLEDSVAPGAKERARAMVVEALARHRYEGKVRAVRVNGCDSPWCLDDVLQVIGEAGQHVDCLVAPKVESPAQVHFFDLLLTQLEARLALERRIGLEVQIESARGLRRVDEIAASSTRVEALIFGPADFASSIGARTLTVGGVEGREPGFWDPFLARILVAARAAGVQAIDGPYGAIEDTAGLKALASRAARLGFDGKWALNPAQVLAVNEAFTPDAEAVARARRILEAYDRATGSNRGAVRLGEEMIDEASRKMALNLVERAGG